jgi:hypothetical protein
MRVFENRKLRRKFELKTKEVTGGYTKYYLHSLLNIRG